MTITTNNKAALWGGFLVVGSYQGATNQSFILDADGDFVWWYADGSDGCGTKMSYDGQYMWMNNGNVPATNGSTHVHRVTMDGMTDTDLSTPFNNMSHQVLPLPDGSVAFYATGSNGCDDIKIFPANGTASSTATTLVNARTAHGGTGACHVNNIEYSQPDDTLVFSDLDNDCLTKVSRTTGATVWVLNGNTGGITSTFTGDLWSGGEHGFHLISPTDILLFNNNNGGSSSQALELTLDTSAKKSTKKWSYAPSPGIKVMVLGDVQRMSGQRTERRRRWQHHRRLRDGGYDSGGLLERNPAPANQEPVSVRIHGKTRHALRTVDQVADGPSKHVECGRHLLFPEVL